MIILYLSLSIHLSLSIRVSLALSLSRSLLLASFHAADANENAVKIISNQLK